MLPVVITQHMPLSEISPSLLRRSRPLDPLGGQATSHLDLVAGRLTFDLTEDAYMASH